MHSAVVWTPSFAVPSEDESAVAIPLCAGVARPRLQTNRIYPSRKVHPWLHTRGAIREHDANRGPGLWVESDAVNSDRSSAHPVFQLNSPWVAA
jgi:hypothetical protein